MKEYQFGLIGYPLEHSRSPVIHRAALHELGLEGDYRLYPIPASSQGILQLGFLLSRLRIGGLNGLNVTIPHKQTVIPHLDRLSPAAQSIGAVNTIYLHGNELVGENTDAAGFLADLSRLAPDLCQNESRVALVLGAGGAARAVCYALIQSSWQVSVAARRVRQGQELAADLRPSKPGQSISVIQPDRASLSSYIAANHSRIALIVNATPIGMHPHDADCPWSEDLPLAVEATVYDLVYNPSVTTLVERARAQGLRAFTGIGMLVEQAARAFEIWTGLPAPREAMHRAVENPL